LHPEPPWYVPAPTPLARPTYTPRPPSGGSAPGGSSSGGRGARHVCQLYDEPDHLASRCFKHF
jgi:hypothetical protein